MKYDNSQLTPMNLFTISEEDAMSLRAWVETTTNRDQLEWLYEQCGECELQVAYTCHVIEERMRELND